MKNLRVYGDVDLLSKVDLLLKLKLKTSHHLPEALFPTKNPLVVKYFLSKVILHQSRKVLQEPYPLAILLETI